MNLIISVTRVTIAFADAQMVGVFPMCKHIPQTIITVVDDVWSYELERLTFLVTLKHTYEGKVASIDIKCIHTLHYSGRT